MDKSKGLYGGSGHLLAVALMLSGPVALIAYLSDHRLLLEISSSVAVASFLAGWLEPERQGDAEDDTSSE